MSPTQLKALIIVLMIMMLISLFDGLYVLFKDSGAPESKRTFHRLVIRAGIAAAMFAAIVYGFQSGKLHSKAPWNRPEVMQQHQNSSH